jgi:hypothetical protein
VRVRSDTKTRFHTTQHIHIHTHTHTHTPLQQELGGAVQSLNLCERQREKEEESDVGTPSRHRNGQPAQAAEDHRCPWWLLGTHKSVGLVIESPQVNKIFAIFSLKIGHLLSPLSCGRSLLGHESCGRVLNATQQPASTQRASRGPCVPCARASGREGNVAG